MGYPWISFVRPFAGGETIITAVQSLPREFRENWPYLGIVEFPMKPGSDGRISKEEVARANRFEALVAAELGGEETNIGHLLGADGMISAFISQKPLPTEVRIKTGLLSRPTFKVVTQTAGWGWYDEYFAATYLELAHATYKGLLANLAAQGDIATISRPVDFVFLCPSEASRTDLGERLTAKGFRISVLRDPSQPGGDYLLEAVLETTIVQAEIDKRCAWLMEVCDQVGATFDGWGTPIQTSP